MTAAEEEQEKLEQETVEPDVNGTQNETPEPETKPDSENEADVTGKEPEKAEEDSEKSPETDKIKEEPAKEDANSAQTINKDDYTPVQGLEAPYEITELVLSARAGGTWLQSANGRWWYLHTDGTYTRNGWEYINGNWFFFDSDGWMHTGWLQMGSNWYYLTGGGVMAVGWQQIGSLWFYFNSSGVMLTTWQYIGGNWYYFNPSDGGMMTGWQFLDGSWYFFNGSGVMLTGWQWIDENWYYFEAGGQMRYNTLVVNRDDGDTQKSYFSNSGVWQYTTSLSDWDLVDSRKHLDWGSDSQYISYINLAMERWNAYKNNVIREDSILTVKDITIVDDEDLTSARAITYNSGEIVLSSYYLSKDEDTSLTLKTVMHELGHALGLGHNESSDVMYYSEAPNDWLTTNDMRSYDEAYERY